MGIHPSKWDYVVGELGKLYGNEALIEGISIFHGIYNQAPEFNDGAEELLRQCKKAGLKLGLVTHSTHEWANLKIDSLGIREFLDHIVVADVTRYKGSEDWKSAIDLFGVDPARVLVAGDNIRGDILAAHEVGVRHLAWIPSNWHVYNTGQLPDGVCKVESIDKLIETLVA
jgi:FMN phosphatase YigB (HAD superfamily)